MELIRLFLAFVRIGFTSFGGLSMVPLINSEMLQNGWMTQSEVTDIVAIAEMTPGPVGLNCATFAGMRVAGLPGALLANLAVLLPAFTTCLAAAVCFEKFRGSRLLQETLYGVRPVCFGLLGATMVTLCRDNLFSGSLFRWQSALIAAAMGFAMWRWKLSVPKVIGLSALLGVVLMSI